MKKLRKIAFAALGLSMLSALPAFAGQWTQDTAGWRYQNDDGSCFNDGWHWIDDDGDGSSEHYYFGADGYILTNTTTPDGSKVNQDGAECIDGSNITAEGTVINVENAAVLSKRVFTKDAAQENMLAKISGVSIQNDSFWGTLILPDRALYASGDTDINFSFTGSKSSLLKIETEKRTSMSDEALKNYYYNIYHQFYPSYYGADQCTIKDLDINNSHWFVREDTLGDGTREIEATTFSSENQYTITFMSDTYLPAEDVLKDITITDDFTTTWINADTDLLEFTYDSRSEMS